MTVPSSVCSLVAALAIVLLGLVASRHVRSDDHFVAGCDRFGYERMARVVRQARASGTPVDYSFRDEQTRWLLSLFPASDDIQKLDLTTIWLLVAGGCGFLAWNAWRGLTLASFLVAGAVAAGLAPFGWHEVESYSVNASILPLFAGTVLAWVATRVRDRRVAVVLGIGAGLCSGLLISARLASALLVPAVALLFVPRRPWLLLPGFAAGVVLAGIGPVLLHDRLITGRLLGATYNAGDTAQTLDHLAASFRFHLGRYPYDSGFLHLAALAVVLLAWLALVSATRPRGATLGWRPWLWRHVGLVASPLCAAGLSPAYFLTHDVTVYYYLTPAILLTGLLLTLLGVTLEEHWQTEAGHFVGAGKPPAVALGLDLVGLAVQRHRLLHRPSCFQDQLLHPRDAPAHVRLGPNERRPAVPSGRFGPDETFHGRGPRRRLAAHPHRRTPRRGLLPDGPPLRALGQ